MTKTACDRCGDCCGRYPCNLLPTDVEPIAQYTNIPVQKLIDKYLILDYYANQGEADDYFLVPKRITDKEETTHASWGWAFTNAPCIFLKYITDGSHPTMCVIH